MKPFNLEAAKAGAPLITRGGESVKFICVEPDAQEDTRLLVLRNGRVLPLYENGKYENDGTNSSVDVFMAPKKKTVWVNLYPYAIATHYSSKEDADKNYQGKRIGNQAWPLEIEE